MSAGLGLFLLGCLLALALFSGAGASVVFADRAALRRHSRTGSDQAPTIERFLERPHYSWTTAMVGGRLAFVAAAGTSCAFLFCPDPSPTTAGAGLLAAAGILFFGRVLPELFFLPRSNQAVVGMAFALRVFFWPLSPLVLLVLLVDAAAQAALGRGRERSGWLTRDELKLLLTAPSARSSLGEEGRQMVDRIFEFSETTVEEAMIPLVEVDALEDSLTVGEAARKIAPSMYSRYPVYHDRIDNIVGALHTVDLMRASNPGEPVAGLVRPPHYVPFNKPLDELLFALQQENFSLAVVVDEYGGCIGIITREDIIEEIVGEIEDEHDEPETLWRRINERVFEANATLAIEELNDALDLDLPEGDYDTLAGFLLFLFRRVPRPGERIRYRDIIFTVTAADPRAIREVRIEIIRLRPEG